MTALADKTCVPCKGGVPPLAGEVRHVVEALLLIADRIREPAFVPGPADKHLGPVLFQHGADLLLSRGDVAGDLGGVEDEHAIVDVDRHALRSPFRLYGLNLSIEA